jgi:hypothetical protein
MVQPIEGATLGLYRQLEARATAGLKDWTIFLVPPPQPLPPIAMEGDAQAEAVRAALVARGVDAARLRVDTERRRNVTLSWVLVD